MPTRNVVITEHQAELIEKLVDSGHYQNASEVLREGLRLIEERERANKVKLRALRKAVQVGMEDIDAGRYHTFETVEALDDHFRTLADKVIRGRAR